MKYRILERKYDNCSIYYPQYREKNVEKYLIGADDIGADRFSEYQFFTEWINGDRFLQKITFSDIDECKKFIKEQKNVGKYIKDIIHPM